MNSGLCIGGPADGRRLSTNRATLAVTKKGRVYIYTFCATILAGDIYTFWLHEDLPVTDNRVALVLDYLIRNYEKEQEQKG